MKAPKQPILSTDVLVFLSLATVACLGGSILPGGVSSEDAVATSVAATVEAERLANAVVETAIAQTAAAASPTPEPIAEATPTPTPTEVPPEPTVAPLPGEVGLAQSSPAPAGSPVEAGRFTLMVLDAIRPANDIIEEAEGSFYDEPDPGEEYIMVRVSVTCNAVADDTCFAILFQFSLVGASSAERDPDAFVTSLPGRYVGDRIQGGITLEGWIPFKVAQEDTDLVLVFQTLAVGAPPNVYLAVPA